MLSEFVVRLAHPEGKFIGRVSADGVSVGEVVVVNGREWRVVEQCERDGESVLVVVPATRSL